MISEIRLRTILLIVLMIGVAVMQWQQNASVPFQKPAGADWPTRLSI
jgi:hypothetical protein